MEQPILVSIVCNAYNHEKYIAQTIDGFVMQKTQFPFEVLIHDDASTDETAEIIRQYEKEYPHIVKPIYQTDNQYSQHISISRTYQFPRAQGKYIAFCEGDDFWTDPLKLQKQVNALEKHPEVDICAHRASFMEDEVIVGESVLKSDQKVPVEEVIKGGASMFTTNTLMFRKSLLGSQNDYIRYFALDYIIQISGSLRGGMLYLGDNMSVYRVATSGSWTMRMRKDAEKRKKHSERVIKLLQQIDNETNHQYSDAFQLVIKKSCFKQLIREGKLKQAISKEYGICWKEYSPIQRLKLVCSMLLRSIRR